MNAELILTQLAHAPIKLLSCRPRERDVEEITQFAPMLKHKVPCSS